MVWKLVTYDQGGRPLEHLVTKCNQMSKDIKNKAAWLCSDLDAAIVAALAEKSNTMSSTVLWDRVQLMWSYVGYRVLAMMCLTTCSLVPCIF